MTDPGRAAGVVPPTMTATTCGPNTSALAVPVVPAPRKLTLAARPSFDRPRVAAGVNRPLSTVRPFDTPVNSNPVASAVGPATDSSSRVPVARKNVWLTPPSSETPGSTYTVAPAAIGPTANESAGPPGGETVNAPPVMSVAPLLCRAKIAPRSRPCPKLLAELKNTWMSPRVGRFEDSVLVTATVVRTVLVPSGTRGVDTDAAATIGWPTSSGATPTCPGIGEPSGATTATLTL